MSKNQVNELQEIRLNEIRSFIKNWRMNEGLSQREFSKLANIHFNSIYNLERQKGKSTNLITILKCIDAMDGMTVSQFFEGIE